MGSKKGILSRFKACFDSVPTLTLSKYGALTLAASETAIMPMEVLSDNPWGYTLLTRLRGRFLRRTTGHGSSEQKLVAEWGGLQNASAGYRLSRFRFNSLVAMDWSPWWMSRTRIGNEGYRGGWFPVPFWSELQPLGIHQVFGTANQFLSCVNTIPVACSCG